MKMLRTYLQSKKLAQKVTLDTGISLKGFKFSVAALNWAHYDAKNLLQHHKSPFSYSICMSLSFVL